MHILFFDFYILTPYPNPNFKWSSQRYKKKHTHTHLCVKQLQVTMSELSISSLTCWFISTSPEAIVWSEQDPYPETSPGSCGCGVKGQQASVAQILLQ